MPEPSRAVVAVRASCRRLVQGVFVLEALDAAAVTRWSGVAVERFAVHREEIDALNVFPVPDSDTGSNMLATMRSAAAELAATGTSDCAAALDALARGAALGAIGNSGFILSQVLRGFAEAAAGTARCDGAVVAAGLLRGAELARAAVLTPVEGTILTVVRAAAEHARGATLAAVVDAAVAAADAAVQLTTGQLAELADAGVVDAGGRGLVVLLDALSRTVGGHGAVLTPVVERAHAPRHLRGDADHQHHSGDGYGFEVQYLLDAPEPAALQLREVLGRLGDSLAVVPTGAGQWKVHVHVDDVGAAIEAGVEAGRPSSITVVRFHDQHDHGPEPTGSAVVAIAPGPGLAHLFEDEGVHVVGGGTDDPPGIEDVVAAIHATGARRLVLLPNASQITGVAEAAAAQVRATGIRVSVVPTRSPVQGLSAIAVHDPDRRFDDDVVAMAEAAAATRYAELAVAQDEALTAVGICQPGDVLGLIDGEVVEIGRGLLAVAFTLIDRLLGVGVELMTILVGADAPRRIGELMQAHVRGRAPLTDVTVYQGGQPDRPVIIGVE